MPPKKPEAPGPSNQQTLFLFLAGLVLVSLLFARLIYVVNSTDWFVLSWWDGLVAYFKWFWPVWKILAAIVSIGAVIWGTYGFLKLQEIESEEEKIYGSHHDDAFLEEEEKAPEEKGSHKWQRVVEHANSENPSDWRLAIIEADVMLEELLKSLGYPGDGVGEMLKGVDKSDMLSLDNAWEAHKVRNRIAHSGGDFELTERETRRVVSLFESVFREFGII
jgi:hypothetical protein